MTRISSKLTWVHKRAFPTLWFGVLAFTGAVAGHGNERIILYVVLVLMAGFGYLLMRKLVWVLVDEVYDCGDTLLVRKGSDEDRILLTSIMNVSMSVATNPSRITLRLLNQSKFGNEIEFMPAVGLTLNPFARNKIFEDLMVRVDRARAGRAV